MEQEPADYLSSVPVVQVLDKAKQLLDANRLDEALDCLNLAEKTYRKVCPASSLSCVSRRYL
jgi:hypothetical protein